MAEIPEFEQNGGRGRMLTDYHIPQYMGFRARDWRAHKSRGNAPTADGTRVNPHGKREEFWFERTLWEWREPRPTNGGWIGPAANNPDELKRSWQYSRPTPREGSGSDWDWDGREGTDSSVD